jgi:anti-sigma B factor antagonist
LSLFSNTTNADAQADTAPHKTDDPGGADRRRHAAPKRSSAPPITKQTDAAPRTASTSSPGLRVQRDDHHNAAVLSVHGELDLATAPALREALLPVLEHENRPVIVDLSEVPFMDSTGLQILVDTHQQLASQKRRFAIVYRQPGQVDRLLALVGLLDVLTVYRSRQSAVTGNDDVLRAKPANDTNHPTR